MVYITDNLCTKNRNSSFVKPKISGLYMRAVTDQEQVISLSQNPSKPTRLMAAAVREESVGAALHFKTRVFSVISWGVVY